MSTEDTHPETVDHTLAVSRLLLRPEEAAQTLAISRSRVYELMAGGEIESIRIGSSRRIPIAALHRFVANQVRVTSDRYLSPD